MDNDLWQNSRNARNKYLHFFDIDFIFNVQSNANIFKQDLAYEIS